MPNSKALPRIAGPPGARVPAVLFPEWFHNRLTDIQAIRPRAPLVWLDTRVCIFLHRSDRRRVSAERDSARTIPLRELEARMHQVRQRVTLILFSLIILIGASTSHAQPTPPQFTVSYAMRFKTPVEIEKVFAPLIADSPKIQLSLDPQHQRVTLTGPIWAHNLFKQVVDRIDIQTPTNTQGPTENVQNPVNDGRLPQSSQPVSDGRSNSATRLLSAPEPTSPQSSQSPPTRSPTSTRSDLTPQPPSATTTLKTTRRLMPLPIGQSKALRDHVLRLFGDRLQIDDKTTGQTSRGQEFASQAPSGQWSMSTPSGTLRIGFDLQREDVLIDGPVSVVDQFGRLLTALVGRYQRQSSDLNGLPQQRVLMLQREVQ